jgi:GT2 family glycosyltransferase
MTDLSIIIVNWHSADYVKTCLMSIFSRTVTISFEVIVIDNASYDFCGEMIQNDFPDVLFIQSNKNLGFAKANNLGATFAKSQTFLLLNPDTELVKDAIDRLYVTFKTLPAPGIVGCKLLNSDFTLQMSCVQPFPTILNQVLDADLLQNLFPRFRLWGNAVLHEKIPKISEVEAISGACMMIDRSLFKKIGGFSADYFMYGEDIDLCYKAFRSGYKNYYIPEAEIVHHGGGSTQKTPSTYSIMLMRESIKIFLNNYYGKLYCLFYRLTQSIAAIIRLMVLFVCFPLWLLLGKPRDGLTNSLTKWKAILRWGVGFVSLPKKI